MKKRLLATILVFCMVLGMLPGTAWAVEDPPTSGKCGDNVTWYFTESTQTLTLTGSGETYPAFGGYWWSDPAPWRPLADKIKYIHVLSPITLIGNGIFRDCTSAIGIILPGTLETIGQSAFPYGSGVALEHFVMESNSGQFYEDSGVLYAKEDDGSRTLYYYPPAMKQTSYTVRSDTDRIWGYGFSNNPYLETVIIPDSVTEIGADTFDGCTALKNIKLPNGITEIEGLRNC